MIITPKELHDRIDEFTVLDVRPETQRNEFPMDGLETIISKDGSTPNLEGKKVLVCQFGIVTEGMIIENDLHNTFSLLGGAQSWIEFQSENEDLSRWSRQTILSEIGMDGQKKLMNATVAVVGLGGLGCPVSQSLVTAGIGKLVFRSEEFQSKIDLSDLKKGTYVLIISTDNGIARKQIIKQ